MNETRIDITHIPFSRYGAYVSVSRDEGKKELIIHNVKRRFEEGPMFSLTFGKDEPQDFVCTASPEKSGWKMKTDMRKSISEMTRLWELRVLAWIYR